MFYRAIGYAVWKLAMKYLRERYGGFVKPGAAAATAVGADRGVRRHARRRRVGRELPGRKYADCVTRLEPRGGPRRAGRRRARHRGHLATGRRRAGRGADASWCADGRSGRRGARARGRDPGRRTGSSASPRCASRRRTSPPRMPDRPGAAHCGFLTQGARRRALDGARELRLEAVLADGTRAAIGTIALGQAGAAPGGGGARAQGCPRSARTWSGS